MKKLITIVLFATVLASLAMAQDLTITTVAGKIVSGDIGKLASSLYLLNPEAVAMDKAGNYFIADTGNRRVVKVDGTTGVTSMVADGLGSPTALLVDASGNLYIADRGDHKIYKIDTAGKKTTFAGTGTGRYSGDGRAATAASINGPRGMAIDASGSIYVAETGSHRVRKIDAAGNITTVAGNGSSGRAGDGAAANRANLNAPEDLAMDANGNLYIADTGNQRIRVVDKNGIINTLAGADEACPADPSKPGLNSDVFDAPCVGYTGDGFRASRALFNKPVGVAVDKDGNILVADRGNDAIRVIRADGSMIRTLIKAGNKVTPGVRSPARIFVAGNGAILIPEAGNGGGFAASKPTCQFLANGGCKFPADKDQPKAPSVTTTNIVSMYDPDRGVVRVLAGANRLSLGNTPALEGYLNQPWGVAVDRLGNIFFSEPANNRVMKVDANGILSVVAGMGKSGFSGDGGPALGAQLKDPRGLAVDALGYLYIADNGNNVIRMLTPGGTISTVVGNIEGDSGYAGDGGVATAALLKGPQGVALDKSGNIYIADTGNNAVRKVASGVITTIAGGNGSGATGDGDQATKAQLKGPLAVAVDSTGTLVYVADSGNGAIRVVQNGIIYAFAGHTGVTGDYDSGSSNGSWTRRMRDGIGGVVVDAAGNVYNSDTKNNVVRKTDIKKLTASIYVGKVANDSSGQVTFAGDGGDPEDAKISNPAGLAFDADGNLFIADQTNGLIRKVGPAPKTK